MCDAHEPASRLPHTHPLSRVHTAADVSRPFLPQGVTSVLATILALAASAVAVAVGIDVAIAASAVAVESNDQFGWDCYGDWIWEDCSGYYYQSDYCTDDCGWWYSAGFDDDWSDDFWVSCDEFYNEWSWC